MSTIKKTFKKNRAIVISYLIAILMFTVTSILKPEFASGGHVKLMLIQASILGILALGQTFVIIMCGIDLSIQWTLNCAAIAITALYRNSGGDDSMLIWMIPAVLLFGLAVGAVNGFGVAYLNIHPTIMTFGMNTILCGGLMAILSGGTGDYTPKVLTDFTLSDFLGIPNLPTILMLWIAIIIIATIVLSRTAYGRRLYAVSNNAVTSYYSGINGKRVKMTAYMVSGFSAALGGILLASKLGQSYLGMGDFVMFETIAVVAIGGTSMLGGSGNYIGTVAGALIITILDGLLSAFYMPAAVEQVVFGLAVLIAVLLGMKRSTKRAVA